MSRHSYATWPHVLDVPRRALRGTGVGATRSTTPDGRSIRSGITATAITTLAIPTAVAAVAALLLLAPSTAYAVATAGTEVITHPGQLAPLTSGGSATPYGVLLPSGASCPGDTAHQSYHVFSYLVPTGVAPTAVSFKTGLPSKYFGYIAEGAYFGAVNTAEGTGQIVGLPSSFTWSRLTPQDLFANGAKTATWEGGIACADTHGVVTNYWSSDIVFAVDAADPGGFTWKVTAPPASASSIGLWLGVALIGVAIVFGIVTLELRRRSRAAEVPTTGRRSGDACTEDSRSEDVTADRTGSDHSRQNEPVGR